MLHCSIHVSTINLFLIGSSRAFARVPSGRGSLFKYALSFRFHLAPCCTAASAFLRLTFSISGSSRAVAHVPSGRNFLFPCLPLPYLQVGSLLSFSPILVSRRPSRASSKRPSNLASSGSWKTSFKTLVPFPPAAHHTPHLTPR